ncbi:histone acetyltransferase HPA2 [Vibrio ishigakensis]|uniref:Histone acetyltransferase HPA2 n=1 Tax=Vibrio ishigakensis TaxID=1481914 RepID=A0A0B8PAJ6_9VIBR|nr:GNAT family N-acetyltransferase [Vibrio ishigakensis]GAM59217.1 histone acetyltransferase HPA2 [Vibrio ishigakensis]GAM59914.1 histone acetyltransferase HPA2 [Vibrio ishigakensis]GAM67944.1 histone acetyltransferase HPA2 [Vibrio sp. JCM 19236]
MTEIRFSEGPIQESDQDILSNGLELHGKQNNAPEYKKTRLNWMVYRDEQLVGALTADLLWDWIYISELWVDDSCRGTGLGKQLMAKVEEYAREQGVTGLWLWTQSWQAPKFYQSVGFEEFTRFEGFPKGHSRIGLRKTLA